MSLTKLFLAVLLFSLSVAVYAQVDDAVCQAIVEQVVASTTSACVGSDGNTACGSSNSVSAVGASVGANESVSVSAVSSVTSSFVSVEDNSWGLGIINFVERANNQTVWLLLLGESSVEKQGDSFQNMSLDTGYGHDDCENIPNMVAIYATGDTATDLTINNLQIRLQGIATFQFQNVNSMVVSLLSGSMEISDANPIQAKESLVAVTDNDKAVLFWSLARPINELEITHGQIAFDVLNRLTGESLSLEPSCVEQAPHIVSSGENLYRISLRYNTTVEELANLNNISDTSNIQVGQVIILPCRDAVETDNRPPASGACGPNTVHIVSRGETLFSIAQLYGTTVHALTVSNNLTNPDTIHAGNILQIPCDDGSYGTAPPPSSDNPPPSEGGNPPPPSSEEDLARQQLCAGLSVTISQMPASAELLAFYQQNCGA